MLNELDVDPNDDEMFLNEDDISEMKRNNRKKVRRKRKFVNNTQTLDEPMWSSASENVHVIFKRPVHSTHLSDFGKWGAAHARSRIWT